MLNAEDEFLIQYSIQPTEFHLSEEQLETVNGRNAVILQLINDLFITYTF